MCIKKVSFLILHTEEYSTKNNILSHKEWIPKQEAREGLQVVIVQCI